VPGQPNRIFHAPFFQRFIANDNLAKGHPSRRRFGAIVGRIALLPIDLRFGRCGIGPKHNFLAHLLSLLDFRQKHFLAVLSTRGR
jgi:hypothetical protein